MQEDPKFIHTGPRQVPGPRVVTMGQARATKAARTAAAEAELKAKAEADAAGIKPTVNTITGDVKRSIKLNIADAIKAIKELAPAQVAEFIEGDDRKAIQDFAANIASKT